ncbi:hypothetical protein ACFS07_15705 [Undibacterium arcticum]
MSSLTAAATVGDFFPVTAEWPVLEEPVPATLWWPMLDGRAPVALSWLNEPVPVAL